MSDEEIEILRDNCKEIRDLTLIEILSSTGIRVGELVKINRKDQMKMKMNSQRLL